MKLPPPTLHQTLGNSGDTLLQDIGEALLRRFGVHTGFTIAGSFAAAAIAHRYFDEENLLYNDIDVFIPKGKFPKGNPNGRFVNDYYPIMQRLILDVHWISDAIQSFPITLNVIVLESAHPRDKKYPLNLDMKHLADAFDINAVQAAINVEFQSNTKEWKILSDRGAYCSRHFNSFMGTRVLSIPRIKKLRNPGRSIVRLAYKCHQMGFPMKLPKYEDILYHMCESTFSAADIEKWESLPWYMMKYRGFDRIYYRRCPGKNSESLPRYIFEIDHVAMSFSLSSTDTN